MNPVTCNRKNSLELISYNKSYAVSDNNKKGERFPDPNGVIVVKAIASIASQHPTQNPKRKRS
jgi:hypothetical protein